MPGGQRRRGRGGAGANRGRKQGAKDHTISDEFVVLLNSRASVAARYGVEAAADPPSGSLDPARKNEAK